MPERPAGFFADDNAMAMTALYHLRQMKPFRTASACRRSRTAEKSA
jgi:hypothetical protein